MKLFNTKIFTINLIILLTIIGLILGVAYQQSLTNRVILSDGSIDYQHPTTPYEKAVDELNNYVPVYEQTIPDNDKGNVIGQTWSINGHPIKVLIEIKDPGVVYHEMYHVITPGGGTEPDADQYATQRGYPIHDVTY